MYAVSQSVIFIIGKIKMLCDTKFHTTIYIPNRDDVSLIKEGEEQKKKMYRALCTLNHPATADVINQLNIPAGFTVNQKTPLRVLHRRPLLTRLRQIFSVKAYIHESKSLSVYKNMLIKTK